MSSLLIVDDDRSVVQLFHRLYQQSETTVLAAGSAAEALGLIQRCSPDVVLLDILLPDQSGLVTFESIRSLDATIPVIFITAMATSDTAIEAMKLGAFDYLLKPLDVKKVREVVSQAERIRRFMHVPVHMADGSASRRRGPPTC